MATSTIHDATALITGASSSIDTAFAEKLACEYGRLVLVAPRLDRLQALTKRWPMRTA